MSGGDVLVKLRQDLGNARIARGDDGWKYAAEIRERVLAYARRRRAEGGGIKSIAAELGLPWQTLDYWLHGRKPEARSEKVPLLPVTLEAEVIKRTGEATLVVHGPRGLRIEGLDIEDLADLVRRLA